MNLRHWTAVLALSLGATAMPSQAADIDVRIGLGSPGVVYYRDHYPVVEHYRYYTPRPIYYGHPHHSHRGNSWYGHHDRHHRHDRHCRHDDRRHHRAEYRGHDRHGSWRDHDRRGDHGRHHGRDDRRGHDRHGRDDNRGQYDRWRQR